MVGKIKSEKKGKKESNSMKKKVMLTDTLRALASGDAKKKKTYFASLNTTLSILPIYFTTRPTS